MPYFLILLKARMKKPVLTTIALVLISSFLMQDILWAAPGIAKPVGMDIPEEFGTYYVLPKFRHLPDEMKDKNTRIFNLPLDAREIAILTKELVADYFKLKIGPNETFAESSPRPLQKQL